MSGRYLMDEDGATREVPDLMEWAKGFEMSKRQIALDYVRGVKISTVFLGVDHSFDGESPVLFETMTFGGPHEYQNRYCTREQAIRGHQEMLAIVKSELEEEEK